LITLKEIAAEAGVSVMTVSNVINNKTAKVSAQTAQRVREIIEKHHYQPNMAARTLISKASQSSSYCCRFGMRRRILCFLIRM